MLRRDLSGDLLEQSGQASVENDTYGTERRRHTRYPANWPACCILDDAFECNVVIENTSDGGFGLSRSLPVDVGTRMIISVEQIGDFACRLAWKDHDRCGVELLPDNGRFSDVQTIGFDLELRRETK